MLKVVDLFSGVGGLSLGFAMAGFDVVFANEIDKEISDSYKKNHPNVKMINEDITKLDIPSVFSELKGKVDVVIGGPPCQGFSQKGSRKIWDDERNYLYKYFYQVVEYLKPTYFLMENVPNLLTSGDGVFKDQIHEDFIELGYNLDSNILNAYEYGVPQIRRRAFILGKLGNSISLPISLSERISIKDAIWDLAYLESGEGDFLQEYRLAPTSAYQQEMRKNSVALYNHAATKHSDLAIERIMLVPPGKGREVLPQEHRTKSIYSGTWSRMLENMPAVTITTRFDTPSSGRFTHPYLHRAITVREAARIQSFPDTFVFYGTKTSQMKQVGNAVPPLLAKSIALSILEDHKESNKIIVVSELSEV